MTIKWELLGQFSALLYVKSWLIQRHHLASDSYVKQSSTRHF